MKKLKDLSVYFRFIAGVIGKLFLFILHPPASIIIPLIYREQEHKELYTWGGLFGTFDNPPQGDRGFILKHSPFRGETKGLKGYINRVFWMNRNPLYGYSKSIGVNYISSDILAIRGNPDISDKYRISGWMWATLRDSSGRLKAFELYGIRPWSKKRNLRIRLGWKIKTAKMIDRGWARHVFTINPLDGYGRSNVKK